MRTGILSVICGALGLLGLAVPALAQQPQQVAPGDMTIELNKLEQEEAGCRVFMIFDNKGPALEKYGPEIIVFDTEGVIAGVYSIEFGPLRPSKITVKSWYAKRPDCSAIDRILVNDILSCDADGAPVDGCFERMRTTSKAEVELVK